MPEARTYLTGWSSTLYMSHDSLYVAYEPSRPYWRYEADREERFEEAVLPLLPTAFQQEATLTEEDIYQASQQI